MFVAHCLGLHGNETVPTRPPRSFLKSASKSRLSTAPCRKSEQIAMCQSSSCKKGSRSRFRIPQPVNQRETRGSDSASASGLHSAAACGRDGGSRGIANQRGARGSLFLKSSSTSTSWSSHGHSSCHRTKRKSWRSFSLGRKSAFTRHSWCHRAKGKSWKCFRL